MIVQKPGLLHPTKNVGFAMTSLLIRKNRKFLFRWPIVGLVCPEHENSQYKMKINENMIKAEVKIKTKQTNEVKY
jgi:hypothetical protein